MSTKHLSLSALLVAFIAVAAQISIPTQPVPFTLQVFAITFVALILPPKRAILTVTVYVLMGLLGFPIFASAHGGFQMILSPTFGFILGFIPYAFLLSSLRNRWHRSLHAVVFILSYIVFYFIGISVLYLNLRYVAHVDMALISVIRKFWIAFIPTDSISIFLAFFISTVLQKRNILKKI